VPSRAADASLPHSTNPPEHAEGGRIRHGCSPLRGEFPLGTRAAGGVMGGLARKGCSVCVRKALRLALRGGEPRVAGCSAVV